MIVSRINAELDPLQIQQSGSEMLVSIGVLDIYGFEIFEKNGFEQLCINYVNEKLQQIFIELTLRAEQDEYAREGIVWSPIPFFNNRVVCELLDGSSPPGLFRILDDVCRTKHTALDAAELDKKMLKDAAQIHAQHLHYVPNNEVFTIRHYAGDVDYQTGKFGETNKDALKQDLVNLMQTSGEVLVSQALYGGDDGSDLKATVTAGTRIRTQCQVWLCILFNLRTHKVIE
jgi:myosin-1